MSDLSAAFTRGIIMMVVLAVGGLGATWKFLTWVGLDSGPASIVGVIVGVVAAILGLVATFIECGELPEKKG